MLANCGAVAMYHTDFSEGCVMTKFQKDSEGKDFGVSKIDTVCFDTRFEVHVPFLCNGI